MYSGAMPKLIIANWKSNKTEASVKEWFAGFDATKVPAEAKVIIAPSFHLLSETRRNLPDNLALCAQDVSPFPMGSYTGEVNAQQLKAAEVNFVLLGHSERRRYFHETHADVAAKISEAITNTLVPVLCLDRDYIKAQAAALSVKDVVNLVVAYEPVAAIGTGNNASAGEVEEAIKEIKAVFGNVPVIYGGSVDEQSVREYLMITDGVLVGGASLDPHAFQKVVAGAQT